MRSRLGLVALLCCAACGDDGASSEPFALVTEDQPAALLSVWGAGADDITVVGGDPRDGGGPLVYHYDGAGWSKLDTTLRNIDLWWAYGFPNGPVFLSGSQGTIVRYENGTFTKLDTPGNQIVFGMWGSSPTDMWAVGGSFGGAGFVWHYDGTAWTVAPSVDPAIVADNTIWKVGGRSATDLWMSGTNGLTLHWNGSTMERVDVSTDSSLFSVAGNAERFITVGGAFSGEIWENTGTGWKSTLPPGGPTLTGVTVSADDAYAVGSDGVILRRGSGTWSTEDHLTNQHLHAAFTDPEGGVWTVGGDYDASPTRGGVLLHKGTQLMGSF